MQLDEAQAGFKIAGENINNLRYADDTTLMAESEEENSNGLEWVNLTQMTIISTTASRNPSEEME